MRNNPMREDIVPFFAEIEKRLRTLEQRNIGSVYVTGTMIARDPETGVETHFGSIPGDGSEGFGLKQWVGDTTPPPVPSEPIVLVSPGIFSVIWDGANAGGIGGASDFSHVNVYGSNGTSTVLVGVIKSKDEVAIVATAEYNEEWVFWFTAVDQNGNESLKGGSSDPVQLIPMVESPDIVEAINNIYIKVQEEAEKSQESADGKNSIWSRPTAPPIDPLKPHIVGDTWFDTANGNRINTWDGNAWVPVVLDSAALNDTINQAITDAQEDATTAILSADGKNSVWHRSTAPTAPAGGFKEGDTWFDTANGNRINKWNGSAWISTVLDSAALSTAINQSITTAQEDATKAQTSADGKNAIWNRTTEPPVDPLKPHKKGDTWFDTANGNRIKTWDGTAWVLVTLDSAALSTAINKAITDAQEDATKAISSADGKNAIWHRDTEPTAPVGSPHKIGDTWFNTAKDNQINKWNGTTWVATSIGSEAIASAVIQSITTAQEDATKAQTSADGKNSNWTRDTPPPNDPLKPHKTGDTWFDTANGNRINTWDGSAWVNMTLGLEGLGTDVAQSISEASASVITDSRLMPGSLSIWPFNENVIPSGSIGTNELADLSLTVRKFNTNRHQIY